MAYVGKKKYSPSEKGLSHNAWYPQCEFKLQSRASLPLLPYGHWISIMYVSRVQARHSGFMS